MENRKVAIVTGASSGIGEACAWQLAKMQYDVVLAARSEEKIKQAAKEILTFGVRTMAIKTDVSNEVDCARLVDLTMQQFGRIDILINNAGISMRSLFDEVDIDVMKKLMDVNFWGTVYCTKYALPEIIKHHGSIVGVSSIAGKKGLPGRAGYSASKFAMEGFLETIRIENRRNGLHVLIACPGFTASNIRKAALTSDGTIQGDSPRDENKMMTAEEVAQQIVQAIERRKRDLVLTRVGKMTVLFNKFFPGWLDKKVYQEMAKEPDSHLK